MNLSSRSSDVLALLLPGISIIFVFSGVLGLGLVWDDQSLSLLPVYRSCDLESILTTPANGFEYLPVRDLSLCLDHALSGMSAGGFHLQNLFWFVLSSLLVGNLYRTLFSASNDSRISERARSLGLACTLVFVLHPLQVESVAFVTARNAQLCLFFLLASLNFHIRFIRTESVVDRTLSVLFTFLALFSKATALPAALLVVLLHAYLKRGETLKTALLRAVPHFAVTLLAAVIHLVLASTHGAMSSVPSLMDTISRIPRAIFIPGFYLYKFAWPLNQSVEYVMDGVRQNAIFFGVAAVLLYSSAGVVIWRGSRARSLSCYLCLSYFIALLPILNLFPTYPPVADRYVQIPLLFLAPFFSVAVLISLQRKWRVVAVLLIVAVLGYLSRRQVPVWTSNETLFSHAVAVDPRAMVSLENLAYTRWWRGAEDEALEAFELIAAQRPKDGQYPLFRAWRAVRLGDYATAEEYLAIARSRNATPYVAHMISGELHTKRGERKPAMRDYERARTDARMRIKRDARARGSLILIERALIDLMPPLQRRP